VKVLHLVHAFQTGGAERVVLNLIDHGSPDVRNFVCSLTGPNDLATQPPMRGVPFRCLDKRRGNDPAVVPTLARMIAESGIDVVHSQGWGTYLEGLVAAKVFAKPRPAFIFAFHGKSIEEARRGMPLRQRLAQRAAGWLTDAYVAPAESMAADYARSTGVRRERIRVIHNGVDTARFGFGSGTAVRRSLGIDADEFVVGFVGRLDPVKDIRGLVETFSIFLRSHEHAALTARLLVVGDGQELPLARRAAASLDARVVFAGSREDVHHCMAAMDVYLQPSFYEGHSLTLLEAMASRLPVVSTAVGGTPEVVASGRNGYLHQAGDYMAMASSLMRLYDSPSLRRTVGESARSTVAEQFSIAAMVSAYERLYGELRQTPEQRCAV
jgi:glycosyltransferase involved in cell wall biosynthesis